MKNANGTRSDAAFDFVFTDGDVGDGGDKGDGAGSKGVQELVVDVGGEKKTFKAEDVTNLLSQQASATQKTQQVSAIMKACEKFGLEPEVFVSQAEGAFSVISDLIEKGYVDEQGNILEKKASNQDITFPTKAGDKIAGFSEDKVAALVAKALEPIAKKLSAIEQDQTHLTRLRISDSIKGNFKNLEDKDISQLFAVAQGDRTKTLMQHAEEFSKKKDKDYLDTKKNIAKELGIDLVEFEANKLLEQDAKGGAGAMFKGKTFSFKKGKESLSPRQAMREFFDKTS